MFKTIPAPTVRPPSRIANRIPFNKNTITALYKAMVCLITSKNTK